jgi:hypothetical protein
MTLTREREAASERALFYAYRNDPAVLALRVRHGAEKRPCACRGVVEADPADPAPGVRLHNESRQHERWRDEHEL